MKIEVPLLDAAERSGETFPNHITPTDIIANASKLQSDFVELIDIMKGVRPDDEIVLPKKPFSFRILGNFAGGEIEFAGKKIKPWGIDPLIGWTGTEFVYDAAEGFAKFPVGAILPFFVAIPGGWKKLDNSGFYIRAGDIKTEITPSQNWPHKHDVDVSTTQPDYTIPHLAQGSIRFCASIRNEGSAQYRQPENTGLTTSHSHDVGVDNNGGESAKPKHIKAIFAEKIS